MGKRKPIIIGAIIIIVIIIIYVIVVIVIMKKKKPPQQQGNLLDNFIVIKEKVLDDEGNFLRIIKKTSQKKCAQDCYNDPVCRSTTYLGSDMTCLPSSNTRYTAPSKFRYPHREKDVVYMEKK